MCIKDAAADVTVRHEQKYKRHETFTEAYESVKVFVVQIPEQFNNAKLQCANANAGFSSSSLLNIL